MINFHLPILSTVTFSFLFFGSLKFYVDSFIQSFQLILQNIRFTSFKFFIVLFCNFFCHIFLIFFSFFKTFSFSSSRIFPTTAFTSTFARCSENALSPDLTNALSNAFALFRTFLPHFLDIYFRIFFVYLCIFPLLLRKLAFLLFSYYFIVYIFFCCILIIVHLFLFLQHPKSLSASFPFLSPLFS